jgi:type II secretory pathway pseudopilin PulG
VKGLTLIEILVAMGIAVVAGVLILQIVVSSMGLSQNQSSQVEGGLNSNDALMEMRSIIKQASRIADSSDDDQLVLKVLSIDASGNIINDIYDDFEFFLDSSTLHFKIIPDAASNRKNTDRIFSTSVDNLRFKYYDSAIPPKEVSPVTATKVRVNLTIKQKTNETEANLRND